MQKVPVRYVISWMAGTVIFTLHSMDMSNNMIKHHLNYDCTETVLLHPLVDLTRSTAQGREIMSSESRHVCYRINILGSQL